MVTTRSGKNTTITDVTTPARAGRPRVAPRMYLPAPPSRSGGTGRVLGFGTYVLLARSVLLAPSKRSS